VIQTPWDHPILDRNPDYRNWYNEQDSSKKRLNALLSVFLGAPATFLLLFI
jgi:hypothetical protein